MNASAVPSDWPTPWELTAPESHVLEYRGGAYEDQPFRLAVKELVARRVLRIERVVDVRRRLRRAKPAHALTAGPLIGSELATPLAVVLVLYRDAPKQRLEALRGGPTAGVPIDGLRVADLAAAARREFGKIERYRELHVIPALVQRGLLAPRDTEGLKGYDWTPAGRQADSELQDWMKLGRQNLSRWTASDLARGVLYAEGAGAALLLMDDLYPELERLDSQRAGAGGGAGGGDHGGVGTDDDDALALDFGGTDLDFAALGGDFGGFAGLGGGDGGGGGGDGGGGGGG